METKDTKKKTVLAVAPARQTRLFEQSKTKREKKISDWETKITTMNDRGRARFLRPAEKEDDEIPDWMKRKPTVAELKQAEDDRHEERYKQAVVYLDMSTEFGIFDEDEKHSYGVGIAKDYLGTPQILTYIGPARLVGRYKFLKDTDGNIYRRKYVMFGTPEKRQFIMVPNIVWEQYSAERRAWERLHEKQPFPELPSVKARWVIFIN